MIRTILIAVLTGLIGFLLGRVTGPAAKYAKVAEQNVILERDLQLWKHMAEGYEAEAAAGQKTAEPGTEPMTKPEESPKS